MTFDTCPETLVAHNWVLLSDLGIFTCTYCGFRAPASESAKIIPHLKRHQMHHRLEQLEDGNVEMMYPTLCGSCKTPMDFHDYKMWEKCGWGPMFREKDDEQRI